MDMLYEFSASVISEVKSQIESLARQEQAIEDAKRRRDKESRKQAEIERDKIHQQLLERDASIVQTYLAATQEADADSFRQAWQKWFLSTDDKPSQQLESWELQDFYQANWERPTVDLTPLPPFSWFLQFTFTLAKPYISKDDNPFYIIDNPIVRDKVFHLPIVRSTSWKGNLYSALWQLGHDRQDDDRMQRLFGEIRGEEGGQAGRLFFYPTFFTKTSLEIINPHDRKHRVGKNPILFESVPAGTSGTFSLLYVPFDLIGADEAEIRRQALEDLQLVAEGLQAMFLTYGFSAKRTSGYGMAEDKIIKGEIRTKADRRELAGKKEEEKKLSELAQEVKNVGF
jgi:CRISPR-associated protein Cmr2